MYINPFVMLSHGEQNSQALISHLGTKFMMLSLYFLTNHLFDYAGLFPPAKLNLDIALKNYFNYLDSPQKDILGKFILPAVLVPTVIEKLSALSESNDLPQKHLLSFSILLSQSKKMEDIQINFNNDVEYIKLIQKHVTSFEICLPFSFYNLREEEIFYYFDLLTKNSNFEGIQLFCEMPFLEQIEMMNFLSIVSLYNDKNRNQKVFIKLRTGGVTKESVPSVPVLANALLQLSTFDIPFKVTAGLHSAVPHFDPDVGAKMHGFLNVLFASMIAFRGSLGLTSGTSSLEEIINILANFGYANIVLQEQNIILNNVFKSDIILTRDEIAEFRRKYFHGIGSCDFLGPVEQIEHLTVRK